MVISVLNGHQKMKRCCIAHIYRSTLMFEYLLMNCSVDILDILFLCETSRSFSLAATSRL